MAATSAPDALAASSFARSAAEDGTAAPWVCLGAAFLLWPALWNGFPIVFADTGTYLSQAMRLYAGWDRPPVYSVLLRCFHWDRSLWPPVLAQALLIAGTVRLALRTFAPGWPVWATAAACAVLSCATAAGVVASRLLPDVFAGVIVVLLLALTQPRSVSRGEFWVCVGGLGVLIATHQSYLPLSAAVLVAAALSCPWRRAAQAAAAPLLAAVLLVSINVAAFGRASLSPFGSVFLLARAIEDGPARNVLARDCPAEGWSLCGRALPRTADEFLWRGAMIEAGGPKAIAPQASAIVARAWQAEPAMMAGTFAANALRQAVMIDAGEGMRDWPEVFPALERFPPSALTAYRASLQASGALEMPGWLLAVQGAVAAISVAVLAVRACRREALAATILLALAVNAAVAGGLSGPHARYASRIMWLAPLFAVLPRAKAAAGR